MEPLPNKDLRRLLLFTIFLGSMFGCLYVFVLQRYFADKPSFNLEILQKLEFLKNEFRYNSTGKLDDKSIWKIGGVLDLETIYKEISGKEKDGKQSNGHGVQVDSKQGDSGKSLPAVIDKSKKEIDVKIKTKDTQISSRKDQQKNEVVEKKICLLDKKTLGSIFINQNAANLDALKDEELSFVHKGGEWWPTDCIPRADLAVVIPYRNRETHLGMFLRHMHKLLKTQMIKYRIFVIEQDDDHEFNRGKLLNVGFKEALKKHQFSCFVFHDIDLLPEDSRNDYACPGSPRHMSVAIDKFNYELIYDELFGGIEMFRREDFDQVNGFSNSFWGWGAEDDNLYYRIKTNGMNLSRPSMVTGRYKMLKHLDMEPMGAPNRRDVLRKSKDAKYIVTDGISSLQYKINRVLELPLFTLIKVNLKKHEDKLLGVFDKL
eukprot:Seg60.4 transcript_id=Seg60.4/GoldUCD/mRNA.D3Y31 product="Beta-1 4-N-acetylgalactosaminyltransferase bre-4" protein_id=Seg60.4/GoldUCD/D3Y31